MAAEVPREWKEYVPAAFPEDEVAATAAIPKAVPEPRPYPVPPGREDCRPAPGLYDLPSLIWAQRTTGLERVAGDPTQCVERNEILERLYPLPPELAPPRLGTYRARHRDQFMWTLRADEYQDVMERELMRLRVRDPVVFLRQMIAAAAAGNEPEVDRLKALDVYSFFALAMLLVPGQSTAYEKWADREMVHLAHYLQFDVRTRDAVILMMTSAVDERVVFVSSWDRCRCPADLARARAGPLFADLATNTDPWPERVPGVVPAFFCRMEEAMPFLAGGPDLSDARRSLFWRRADLRARVKAGTWSWSRNPAQLLQVAREDVAVWAGVARAPVWAYPLVVLHRLQQSLEREVAEVVRRMQTWQRVVVDSDWRRPTNAEVLSFLFKTGPAPSPRDIDIQRKLEREREARRQEAVTQRGAWDGFFETMMDIPSWMLPPCVLAERASLVAKEHRYHHNRFFYTTFFLGAVRPRGQGRQQTVRALVQLIGDTSAAYREREGMRKSLVAEVEELAKKDISCYKCAKMVADVKLCPFADTKLDPVPLLRAAGVTDPAMLAQAADAVSAVLRVEGQTPLQRAQRACGQFLAGVQFALQGPAQGAPQRITGNTTEIVHPNQYTRTAGRSAAPAAGKRPHVLIKAEA